MPKRRLCADQEDADQSLVKRNHVSTVQTGFVTCHDNRGKSHISSTSGTNHRSKPDAEGILTQPAILPQQRPCNFCGAKKFYLEPNSFYCMARQVSLVSSNCPPELDWLYTSNSEEAKEFRTYVRTYNNSFAFTSFGVKYDKELCRRNKGIYTFRIQGQVYHFINELTSSNENLSHLQLYFYDTDHEIQNRMKSSEKLNLVVLERLIKISHLNPYSIFFRRLEHIDHLNSIQIIIRSDVSLD
ncbi:hypothetical protein ACSBR1_018655 [Camellia fascicularis]